MAKLRWVKPVVTVLLGAWILFISFFFFVRFTAIIYGENRAQIDHLLGWSAAGKQKRHSTGPGIRVAPTRIQKNAQR